MGERKVEVWKTEKEIKRGRKNQSQNDELRPSALESQDMLITLAVDKVIQIWELGKIRLTLIL